MIFDAARALEGAIANALGGDVPVTIGPPGTEAPPVVWLELESVVWSAGAHWSVTWVARILADPAMDPGPAYEVRAAIGDAVMAAGQRLGIAGVMRATPGTVTAGDGSTLDTLDVAVPQAFTRCDVPPLPPDLGGHQWLTPPSSLSLTDP